MLQLIYCAELRVIQTWFDRCFITFTIDVLIFWAWFLLEVSRSLRSGSDGETQVSLRCFTGRTESTGCWWCPNPVYMAKNVSLNVSQKSWMNSTVNYGWLNCEQSASLQTDWELKWKVSRYEDITSMCSSSFEAFQKLQTSTHYILVCLKNNDHKIWLMCHVTCCWYVCTWLRGTAAVCTPVNV